MLESCGTYLAKKGVNVPATLAKDLNGNLSFIVQDPDGHSVQFIQYLPGSIHSQNFGKHISHKRLSDHILHVGIRVIDPARADKFYKDILGFRLMWKGGRTDTPFRLDLNAGSRWPRLGGIHGDGANADTPATRRASPLLPGHARYPGCEQDSGRARLSTAETAEYRSRRPLAAAALRQKLHKNRTDGTEAGGNAVLLTYD